jgi:hypothetical protein
VQPILSEPEDSGHNSDTTTTDLKARPPQDHGRRKTCRQGHEYNKNGQNSSPKDHGRRKTCRQRRGYNKNGQDSPAWERSLKKKLREYRYPDPDGDPGVRCHWEEPLSSFLYKIWRTQVYPVRRSTYIPQRGSPRIVFDGAYSRSTSHAIGVWANGKRPAWYQRAGYWLEEKGREVYGMLLELE